MKEINILGMNLRDDTMREKLRLVNEYLKGGKLRTVEYISAQILLEAERDPQQKQWLEAMDIIAYCDVDIARASGITSRARLKEIETNGFFNELLRKLAREMRTVYLLTDTEDNLAGLEAEFDRLGLPIRLAGKSVFEDDMMENGADIVINDINDKAPNVVLALFPYPVQEAFVFRNGDRINADLWVGLQKDSPVLGGEEKGLRSLAGKLQRKLFRRRLHRYENQEKTER